MKTRHAVMSVSSVLLVAGLAWGSPGLDVRSLSGGGPITPGFGPAGPGIDPSTANGQWFVNSNGLEDYRTHEFHDNMSGTGGGAPDYLAIRGSFQGYSTSGGLVNGYQMLVSITNNTPNTSGPWGSLPNTHGENRLVPWPNHSGTMYGVRYVSHWADDGIAQNYNAGGANLPSNNPDPGAGTSFGTSNTFATNHDAVAWYSFTFGTAASPPGAYQVPAWDFGDIAVGQTVSRLLTFQFYTALNPAQVLPPSTFFQQDLLIARSEDIKIGAYFQDDPVLNGILDRPIPNPPGSFDPSRSQYANSSVFYSVVPTPGTGALLTIGGMMMFRRRRA